MFDTPLSNQAPSLCVCYLTGLSTVPGCRQVSQRVRPDEARAFSFLNNDLRSFNNLSGGFTEKETFNINDNLCYAVKQMTPR